MEPEGIDPSSKQGVLGVSHVYTLSGRVSSILFGGCEWLGMSVNFREGPHTMILCKTIFVGPLHGPTFSLSGNRGLLCRPRLTMNATSFGVGGDACKNDNMTSFGVGGILRRRVFVSFVEHEFHESHEWREQKSHVYVHTLCVCSRGRTAGGCRQEDSPNFLGETFS